MKVGLAAGVLNECVGKVLGTIKGAEGTSDFVLTFAK